MEISTSLKMSEYLDDHGIGSSSLKKILISPADFNAGFYRKNDATKSTDFGTAVHTAILEPHLLNETVAMQEDDWGPKNRGEGYKKWKQFKEDNRGKIILDYEQSMLLNNVKEKCLTTPSIRKILSSGDPETTAFCEVNGIRYKARTDWIDGDGIVWDVKTSRGDFSDDELQKLVFNRGYHFQAAHQLWVFENAGMPLNGWGWIFVSTETDAIHVLPRRCSGDLLFAGMQDHAHAIQLLEKCMDANEWPGYDTNILEINLPTYARKFYELQTSA